MPKDTRESKGVILGPIPTELNPKTYIIIGRGGLANTNKANKIYREFIGELSQEYNSCTNLNRKRHIVTSIVESLKQNGFHFVKQSKQDNNLFVEVTDDNFIREKTAQRLRDKRLKKAPLLRHFNSVANVQEEIPNVQEEIPNKFKQIIAAGKKVDVYDQKMPPPSLSPKDIMIFGSATTKVAQERKYRDKDGNIIEVTSLVVGV